MIALAIVAALGLIGLGILVAGMIRAGHPSNERAEIEIKLVVRPGVDILT